MQTPATKPDPPPLAYGRLAPLHRRTWVRWCLCAGLVAGLFAGSRAAWQRFGVPWQRERERQRAVAQEKARVGALKQEWMTYREPPNRVVYAGRADLPPGWLAGGSIGTQPDLPAPRRAWPFAPAEARVPSVGPPLGHLAFADWEVLLLLHGRRTPAGHERAVLLVAYPGEDGAGWTPQPALGGVIWFWYAMIDLAAWSGKPTLPPPPKPGMAGPSCAFSRPHAATRGYGAWRFPPDRERSGALIRLFAGQPDPDDPTHFTIGYEYDGQPGTIDGHLEDAAGRGESIRFVVRDGPVADAADPTSAHPATGPAPSPTTRRSDSAPANRP